MACDNEILNTLFLLFILHLQISIFKKYILHEPLLYAA